MGVVKEQAVWGIGLRGGVLQMVQATGYMGRERIQNVRIGAHTCTCKAGWQGDGNTCTG